MIKKLLECGVKEPENRIVVLSPYRAQCHLIREELAQQGLPEIPVMTIVKSQGRLIVHFCSYLKTMKWLKCTQTLTQLSKAHNLNEYSFDQVVVLMINN